MVFLAAGHPPVPEPKLTWVCGPEPRNVPGPSPRTNGKLMVRLPSGTR